MLPHAECNSMDHVVFVDYKANELEKLLKGQKI